MRLGMTANAHSVLDTGSSIIVDSMAYLMNLVPRAKKALGITDHKVLKATAEGEIELPMHFDAREKWPKCIHDIRDQ